MGGVEKDEFDCVIVGARCAGAPLAVHLARGGMKVCLLDQDKLPSDQPFSTHAIQPVGMDYLDELGVGPKIRAVTPPIRNNRLKVGRSHVDLSLAAGREMYCPRRSTLDPLLAECAVSSGAELRDETAVLDVIRDGSRVVGVRARHAGETHDIRARFVVGADGRNSTVAKLVRAAEYHGMDGDRGGYWAYYPLTKEFAANPFQTYIEIQGKCARFAFHTDGGLVVAGALEETSSVRAWAKNIESQTTASLMKSDVIRSLVEGNAPVTPFVGLLRGRWFFHDCVGPGWALVGDAGLHKDPTPGYGITDALRDAKALSSALLDGRDAALEVYWRARDLESVPLFANASAMGSLDYDNPFNELIIEKLGAPEFREPLRRTIERELSPFETIPAWRVLAWAASALVRGHTEIWPHFVAGLERGTKVAKEVKRRAVLLDLAKRRLAAPP